MQRLTSRLNRRLARQAQRQMTKVGLGVSAAAVQRLEGMIRKGVARMGTQGVLENEAQIRLAEDNLRRLASQLVKVAEEHRTFPNADEHALDVTLQKLCPLWPYC